MKRISITVLFVIASVCAFAQNTFKARFDAGDYSKWQLVIYSSAASGSSTVQVSYPGATLNTGSQTACTFTAVNGRTFSPIAVGVPITINDSSSETVTPTAVTNTPTGCSFTATLASAHAARRNTQFWHLWAAGSNSGCLCHGWRHRGCESLLVGQWRL
jgi:hypothetical protein